MRQTQGPGLTRPKWPAGMKNTAVDPFDPKMPEVTDAADGTQDTLLVRIRIDARLEVWGECDASPRMTLAAYCYPMSHGNIINVQMSLLGETLDRPDDVRRLHRKMLRNGLDIAQIHHAVSGAGIALWDLVGQRLGKPIHTLLDDGPAYPKTPMAASCSATRQKRRTSGSGVCISIPRREKDASGRTNDDR
jgi:L-alanine-DL-glutamate epimerase-like enolase superfamily enzyme